MEDFIWILLKCARNTVPLYPAHIDSRNFSLIEIGSLARLGPNELVTSDPNILRRMAAVRSPYRKSEWYDGLRFEPEYDSMISERNEEKHLELRAKCAVGVRRSILSYHSSSKCVK